MTSRQVYWRGRGFGWGIGGLAAGAIIGGAIASGGPYGYYGGEPYYGGGYGPGYGYGYAPAYYGGGATDMAAAITAAIVATTAIGPIVHITALATATTGRTGPIMAVIGNPAKLERQPHDQAHAGEMPEHDRSEMQRAGFEAKFVHLVTRIEFSQQQRSLRSLPPCGGGAGRGATRGFFP